MRNFVESLRDLLVLICRNGNKQSHQRQNKENEQEDTICKGDQTKKTIEDEYRPQSKGDRRIILLSDTSKRAEAHIT
jgi:hypothetical protein